MKKANPSEKDILTLRETTELFGLSHRRFIRLLGAEPLPAFIVSYGNRRLVMRKDFERWLQQNPKQKEMLQNDSYRKTRSAA